MKTNLIKRVLAISIALLSVVSLCTAFVSAANGTYTKSSAYDSIMSGAFYPTNEYASLGGMIYKSNVTYASHIKNFVQPLHGAHYYVQSPYSNTYDKAKAFVDLSTVQVDTKGKRNAYISLGTKTEKTSGTGVSIDFGLVNEGSGWCAVSYMTSTGAISPSYTENFKKIYAGAAKVDFYVRLIAKASTDDIDAYFIFYDSSYNVLGTSYILYQTAPGQLFKRVDGKPVTRFIRFMSLVPKVGPTTDDKDDSYLNATLSNLKLCNSSGEINWDASNIQFAWSMQGANINSLKISTLTSSPVASNADRIEIIHRYQLH